jgi:hypothetical protein
MLVNSSSILVLIYSPLTYQAVNPGGLLYGFSKDLNIGSISLFYGKNIFSNGF